MGIELGRISGPLLSANLLRHGTDLAFETDLLYLDVNTGRIGIKTDSPTRTLAINNSALTTNVVVDTQADIADFTFVSNRLQNPAGKIYITPDQLSDPTVVINELRTDELKFEQRSISALDPDTHIELTADTGGRVVFYTEKVNVLGNLHATGNITWDGNLTIGNATTDSISFEAEFTSSLVPDVDNSSNLGSPSKVWSTLYAEEVSATNIVSPSLIVNDIDLLTTQGNTIYVSVNGSDANYGDHLHSTFRTLKHALSVAQSGDEIVIFPGEYEEIFPLTIPQGVSVRGTGIRSVAIYPTVATNNKDCFLLNGETTVSFLTIKNYFFDAVNNTGYAFKFATNMQVTSRSPYVFNITVITRGSVTTLEDPVGFIQGDAGAGAYLDGSVVNSASNEATGLFHAVTFITPNQDSITALNGVRVEWLNSFTYFAKRGIFLTTGTLGFASLGVKFGAEMRSINSANVYGTYGAVADGANTLGYLVGHNFGYIGAGGDSTNDRSLVIQGNEIVAINGGELFYDSMDHKGDYRIGDVFYVNQETGRVIFDAQDINFAANGEIILEGPSGTTIINAAAIQTGNIRIYDNSIVSLTGPVSIYAQSGSTFLNTDVNLTGTIGITGDVTVDGNVYIGDNPLDLVSFAPKLTQTIAPNALGFNLGSTGVTPKIWRTAFVTALNVDDVIDISSNTISTLTTDTDLELVAAGTGKLQISNTDVEITNNLTIIGETRFNSESSTQSLTVVGTTTLTGDIGQTGDTNVIGLFGNNNIAITGASSYFEVNSIKLQNAVISATSTNSDLQFVATGTAGVIIDSKLKITDNIISNVWASATTNSQKSIIFSPNGTGNLVIDAVTSLTLPYSNNSTKTLSASGEIRQNSTTGAYEGYLNTGPESFNNLYDVDKNTYITPELTLGANDNTLRFGVNGTVRATITSTVLTTPVLQVGSFVVSGNTINNSIPGSDLFLTPTGTGVVNFNNIPVKDNNITNTTNTALNLVSTGNGYIKFAGTGAVVLPYGTTEERRDTPEVGETRFNSTLGYMEVHDGTTWVPAVGVLGAAPLAEVLDIMDFWSLILG